jgi:hypothetical protein
LTKQRFHQQLSGSLAGRVVGEIAIFRQLPQGLVSWDWNLTLGVVGKDTRAVKLARK